LFSVFLLPFESEKRGYISSFSSSSFQYIRKKENRKEEREGGALVEI
jgi:hypothetical protein